MYYTNHLFECALQEMKVVALEMQHNKMLPALTETFAAD